jgi:hypothetical protein
MEMIGQLKLRPFCSKGRVPGADWIWSLGRAQSYDIMAIRKIAAPILLYKMLNMKIYKQIILAVVLCGYETQLRSVWKRSD